MPTKNIRIDGFGSAQAPASHGSKKKCSDDHSQEQYSPVAEPIAVVLRQHGIDEHTIAETLAYTLDALKGLVPVKDSDKKLLIEFVKECTKLLKGDAEATAIAPQQVRLIHKVARPNRSGATEGARDAMPAQERIVAGSGDPRAQGQGCADDGEHEEEVCGNSKLDDGPLN